MQFTKKKLKIQRCLTFFDSKEIRRIEKKERKGESEYGKDKTLLTNFYCRNRKK